MVDISALDPEEGHRTPTSEKHNEEEQTDDVCAGSFLFYRIISIITIGFSIGLVFVPLKYVKIKILNKQGVSPPMKSWFNKIKEKEERKKQ